MLEEESLIEALDAFAGEGWITGTPLLLKSGKEATAYRCVAGPATGQSFYVAKVYRDQERRGFRNDAVYRAGRFVRDTRLRRALANKSRAGRQYQFNSWVVAEYTTLRALHAAGASVPRPVAQAANAILMEYIGDAAGAAPPLQRVKLEPQEAHRLFEVLLREVERWLYCNYIHGDLSAYNILYWRGRLTVIDFPQAVDPRSNPHGYALLLRDVEHVAYYFARSGVPTDATGLADRMWNRFWRVET